MRGFKTIKKQPTQPQSQSQPQYEVADVLNKMDWYERKRTAFCTLFSRGFYAS